MEREFRYTVIKNPVEIKDSAAHIEEHICITAGHQHVWIKYSELVESIKLTYHGWKAASRLLKVKLGTSHTHSSWGEYENITDSFMHMVSVLKSNPDIAKNHIVQNLIKLSESVSIGDLVVLHGGKHR